MLLRSERHTPADLELWRELERADRAANVQRLAKMESDAVDCIRHFARDSCYLSVSGGKDSSVLWSLCHLANCGIKAFHLDTRPLADPHVVEVFAALQHAFPMTLTVVENWCERDAAGWHATGTFERGVRSINRDAGTTRYICGVRADESGVRTLSCRIWGKETINSCRPLAWWSATDIYSYAAIRGVPLHPNYAMLGGGRWPREKLRVAFLGLTHGEGHGRAAWEAEYYGDVLRRLDAGLTH